jgi:hypothetical protein
MPSALPAKEVARSCPLAAHIGTSIDHDYSFTVPVNIYKSITMALWQKAACSD